MFKNIFSPVQAWLLSQGKCVGCGMPLNKAAREPFDEISEKVTCKCKRIYIFDKSTQKYRRALLNEV